jgi:hypothetical protein
VHLFVLREPAMGLMNKSIEEICSFVIHFIPSREFKTVAQVLKTIRMNEDRNSSSVIFYESIMPQNIGFNAC